MDSTIKLGATGGVSKGSVLDVNKAHLEAAMKRYDPQLYLKWNPTKNKGFGLWEVRRKPEKKSAIPCGVLDGVKMYSLEYKELDIINLIVEVPNLSYAILDYLKSADTWDKSGFRGEGDARVQQWIAEKERREESDKEELRQKNYDNAIYNMMQNRSVLRDIKESIKSGVNPAELAKVWK